MMQNHAIIKKTIPYARLELQKQMSENGNFINVKKGDTLVVEGQYIHSIPIVIEGLLKVVTSSAEKELLVYYIHPGESCIMSFSAAMNNEKSNIIARAEADGTILLLPSLKVLTWVRQYSEFNELFYKQFHKRYVDLLNTIDHLVNDTLDIRIYKYLVEKVKITGKNPIQISHRNIAKDLGTAREVVSRIIKRLENEGKVIQQDNTIRLISI